MTDDARSALEWLRDVATLHRKEWLRETAREVLAHIAALEARAKEAEARAEKLRQERDDFADMVGAELCHQPGTVTAEWDAAKRRAEAAEAREAELRAALERIDNSISAGITETDGPARVKAGGDTRVEDGFIVGQFAIQFELIMKCVRNVCRKALAAAPAAEPKSRKREAVYKAVERILDEESAWVARPSPEVTKRIALAATIAAFSAREDDPLYEAAERVWNSWAGGALTDADMRELRDALGLVSAP